VPDRRALRLPAPRFEKSCGRHTWHNLIPYVDRLTTARRWSTTLLTARRSRPCSRSRLLRAASTCGPCCPEYSRIADHLTASGAAAHGNRRDDRLPVLMSFATTSTSTSRPDGARLTTPTGDRRLARDLPEGWLKRLDEILTQYDESWPGPQAVDRTAFSSTACGRRTITAADAVNWGFTGPILRSTGVPARPAQGHSLPGLAELDFEVPVRIKVTTTIATSCACARWTSRCT